jgi:hypothetical protein
MVFSPLLSSIQNAKSRANARLFLVNLFALVFYSYQNKFAACELLQELLGTFIRHTGTTTQTCAKGVATSTGSTGLRLTS